MTGNLLIWLALAAVVLVSLVLKGYVKLPSFAAPSKPGGPFATNSQPTLDGIDSYSLGIAFAKAKRAEAEFEVAHTVALQAGEAIKATFAAPFSAPAAPAGPAPTAVAPQ